MKKTPTLDCGHVFYREDARCFAAIVPNNVRAYNNRPPDILLCAPCTRRALALFKPLPKPKGRYLAVDVFTTTRVPTANAAADRAGGMFGAGATVWADGTQAMDMADSNRMVLADKVIFERIRSGRAGLTALLSRKFVGMSEGLDAAGVSVITDA